MSSLQGLSPRWPRQGGLPPGGSARSTVPSRTLCFGAADPSRGNGECWENAVDRRPFALASSYSGSFQVGKAPRAHLSFRNISYNPLKRLFPGQFERLPQLRSL